MHSAVRLAAGGRSIRRIAGAAVVLTLVVTGVVLSSAPASAHAIVRSTSPPEGETVPAAPDDVVMHFNEPVEVSFGSLRVFDGTGRRVDEGPTTRPVGEVNAVAVSLAADLPDGTYTVTWRVISADGHPIEEAFVFHVGEPGTHPEGVADRVLAGETRAGLTEAILLRTARWVGFISLFVLLGGAFFMVTIWRRTAAGRQPATDAVFLRRWRPLMVGAWLTLLLATLAAFTFQGALAANVPLPEAFTPTVMRAVLTTRFGQVVVLQVLLLVVAAALWRAFLRTAIARPQQASIVGASAAPAHAVVSPLEPPALPRPVMAVGAVLVVLLAMTPGLAGHAGTTPPVVANLATDLVHVLAGAAWLGGLVMLVAAAFPAFATIPEEEQGRLATPVVARFSNLALIAVAVLVLTGVLRGWLEVWTIHALVEEPYGLVLLTKVGVVVPLLGLGAFNNRWVKRRRAEAAAGGRHPSGALRVLRRTVTAEVVLVVIVLAVTAVLVHIAPARVTAMPEGPHSEHVTLGELQARITVEPNRVGPNTVTIVLPHDVHQDPLESVQVRFVMPEHDIGPLVAEAVPEADRYVVTGHHLSVPGEWQIEVVAAMDRFTDASAVVTVHVDR